MTPSENANAPTPPPWHLGTDGHVYAGETGRELVAEVSHGTGEASVKGANGRRIVVACNHFDRLEAACRLMLDSLDGSAAQVARARGVMTAALALAAGGKS